MLQSGSADVAVGARPWARVLLGVALGLVLGSCVERRSYPLMAIHPPDARGLELGAVAVLPSGLLVAIAEKDSTSVYEAPPLRTDGSDFVDLVRWMAPAEGCGAGDTPRVRRCRDRNYRALVPLQPRPIEWLPGDDGAPARPVFIEDLAPLPCADETPCPDRMLGVTEFSTIGRVTGYRADKVAHGREETERLFVLEKRGGGWHEVRNPSIEHLREELSDWGRAHCGRDMIVEGLAVDPAGPTVFLGLHRCLGPAQTVLAYPLGLAQRGGAAALSVVAEGIVDRDGNAVEGPSEGISSLDWAHGRLWGTSSWDDFGYPSEPAYGGRLLVRDGARMVALPTAEVMSDRADALAIISGSAASPFGDTAEGLLPWVHALVLFDNDFAADRPSRPNGTVLRASTPAPPGGRRVALLELGASPFGDQALGLNGLDLEWYWRDHRLGLVSVVADRGALGPGAWTAALGGLWQVRLGALGRATRSLPLLGKSVGHNRQSADVTDYSVAPELRFTGYRAVVSVVPRAPTGDDRSIADLLERSRVDFETVATLPEPAGPDAGLVLQGFTIDASPRARGGVCVSALDTSLDWAGPPEAGARTEVRLRTALLGGVCNDFNAQSAEEHHGLTTDASSGVRVTLYFAVVEGAPARSGSITAAQRDQPGARRAATHVAYGPGPHPPMAPYTGPDAPDAIGNHGSKGNLACLAVDPEQGTARPLPTGPKRHGPSSEDVEWWVQPEGELPMGSAQHRGGSLRGFAWALDLRGFEPDPTGAAHADISELAARSQNVYAYRYQVRAWTGPEPELHLEGGLSHGLHFGGLGKDNAQPTAVLTRADLTWWDDLSAAPERWAGAGYGRRAHDPNVHPEDGYLRWVQTRPIGEAACLPR